jgi:hypothetical protein
MKKEVSLIPPGEYCYRLIRKQPGEVLSQDYDRFGRDLREFSYNLEWKEVLCPYWFRTDYGMVRCDFLGVESLDDDNPDAKAEALCHFGSEAAFLKANHYSLLYDQIKICDLKVDDDEEWLDIP